MNKKVVDALIPEAYDSIKKVGIATVEENIYIVDNRFRGQMAAFGAAIMTGSLLSAISFFSSKGSSEIHREKILEAICLLLKLEPKEEQEELCSVLFKYVKDKKMAQEIRDVKENIINAAIAIKLALNLFTIKKEENLNGEGSET